MPNITNPQVVKFANERARIFADCIETMYETARRFQLEYATLNGDTLIPNTQDYIADDSDKDGRKRMTAAALRGLNVLAGVIVAYLDGGIPSRISQVRALSVNGQSRF